MTLSRILAVFLLLTLAGCVETRFESPLGDNIETCDAGWKGLWVSADESNHDRPDETDGWGRRSALCANEAFRWAFY